MQISNKNMDEYDRAFDIMTEALQTMRAEGITKQDALPALVDFVTAVALILAQEAGVRAVTARMESRIDDWRAGRFPVQDVGFHRGRQPR